MTTKTRCSICPKGCELAPGETGDCRVRQNIDGKIRCTTYNHPCSLNIDPIEKKPLFHFLPGSSILSIATAGCNLHCKQCQNWSLSQSPHRASASMRVRPGDVARMAVEKGCPAIAYTYTEPLVSFEYTYDCCKAAAEARIKNVPRHRRLHQSRTAARNLPLRRRRQRRPQILLRRLLPRDLRRPPRACAQGADDHEGVRRDARSHQSHYPHAQTIPKRKPNSFAAGSPKTSESKPRCTFRASSRKTSSSTCRPHRPELSCAPAKSPASPASGLSTSATCKAAKEKIPIVPNCGKLLIERTGYHVRKNRLANGQCPACQTPISGIWE